MNEAVFINLSQNQIKSIVMKKLVYILAIAIVPMTIVSCTQTEEEKRQENREEIREGIKEEIDATKEDVREGVEKTKVKVEEGAEKTKEKMKSEDE